MNLEKVIRFSKKHYFILLFVCIILLVGLFISYKLLVSKPHYSYVKVKLGQGYWWAATVKPSSWMINSIRKNDKTVDFFGGTQGEILSVRYYPANTPNWAVSQYDAYIHLKLKSSFNSRTNTYTFNRINLSPGNPIEVQFPSINITGAIIEVSNEPIQDEYVDKTVYIIYQGGYTKDFPYRYDNIKVGDSYTNGEMEVFKVEDKWLEKNIWSIANNLTAQIFERAVDTTQNIVVKAKVKLRKKGEDLFYGEDYKVYNNAFIPFATNNYFFENFVVRKIED